MPPLKSLVVAATHYARTWLRAAPWTLWSITAGAALHPRQSQEVLHALLQHRDIEYPDPLLETIDVAKFLPLESPIDITIEGPYYSRRSSDTRLLMELAALAYLVKASRPGLIFEFGTFVGRATRLMAINAPLDSHIVTLDLPQQAVKHTIGEAFNQSDVKDRITQLAGDSRAFDFAPWAGKCDFVWVDANHDYPFVAADTLNALLIIKPGGWIAWHDYRHTAYWSGVTKCVRQLHECGAPVKHVTGTTIAVMRCTGDLADLRQRFSRRCQIAIAP
jgi:predicted O-methyltransferase YrrM